MGATMIRNILAAVLVLVKATAMAQQRFVI